MNLSEQQIRDRFAAIRKLVAFTGPPNNQTCQFEEDLIELAARERRAPTDLTLVDGWPAGGDSSRGRATRLDGKPESPHANHAPGHARFDLDLEEL